MSKVQIVVAPVAPDVKSYPDSAPSETLTNTTDFTSSRITRHQAEYQPKPVVGEVPEVERSSKFLSSKYFYLDQSPDNKHQARQLGSILQEMEKEIVSNRKEVTDIVIAFSPADAGEASTSHLAERISVAVENICREMKWKERFSGELRVIEGTKATFLSGEIGIDLYSSAARQAEIERGKLSNKLHAAEYQGEISATTGYLQAGVNAKGLIGDKNEAQINFGLAPEGLGFEFQRVIVDKEGFKLKVGGELRLMDDGKSGLGPTLSVQPHEFKALGTRLGIEITGMLDFVQGPQIKAGLRIPLHK